jgi:hypothetical protein
VDSERVELSRDGDFFIAPEHDRGLLLAVAKRDIVDLELAGETIVLPQFRQVTPGADEPLVGFPGLLFHLSSLSSEARSEPRDDTMVVGSH